MPQAALSTVVRTSQNTIEMMRLREALPSSRTVTVQITVFNLILDFFLCFLSYQSASQCMVDSPTGTSELMHDDDDGQYGIP